LSFGHLFWCKSIVAIIAATVIQRIFYCMINPQYLELHLVGECSFQGKESNTKNGFLSLCPQLQSISMRWECMTPNLK